jgi:hypothetical protein
LRLVLFSFLLDVQLEGRWPLLKTGDRYDQPEQ